MKNLIIIFFILSSISSYSQSREKESVYLLFNSQSKEKCIIEDGLGNSLNLNKFRKDFNAEYIYFRICNETFTSHRTKSFKDTCSIKSLDNIKLVNLKYMNEKKAKNILRYNPFNNIYIIEKKS